ncbi:MAG TPA: mechanosensitive ion channel [Candidatus Gastranaerophilales bacterium]|nr:mechanosensitive ion channel [Candidatus Gastranaerophilales bacterium]
MIDVFSVIKSVFQHHITGLIILISILIIIAYFFTIISTWILQNYFIKIDIFPENYSLKNKFFSTLNSLFFLIGFKIFQSLIEMPATPLAVIEKAWQIAFIVVSVVFFVNLVDFLKRIIAKKFNSSVKDNLKQRKIITQLDFMERIIVIILFVLGFSAILLNFEGAKKIGASLIASAGLAGIIIGFAAQKTISSLIAGFQIAFTQPFRIDDVVVVDKEWGWIEEISLTYVVIRIWDKRRLIVPITYLLENPFQNWTRHDTEIIGYIYIYADYTVPLVSLRDEFQRLIAHTELWNGKDANVQVTNSNEKTQEIRFLFSADDSAKLWDLKCYLREHLINFLQKNYPESLPKYRLASEKSEIPLF